jgi:hypothetical protein
VFSSAFHPPPFGTVWPWRSKAKEGNLLEDEAPLDPGQPLL